MQEILKGAFPGKLSVTVRSISRFQAYEPLDWKNGQLRKGLPWLKGIPVESERIQFLKSNTIDIDAGSALLQERTSVFSE
jgi:hypothetical protein